MEKLKHTVSMHRVLQPPRSNFSILRSWDSGRAAGGEGLWKNRKWRENEKTLRRDPTHTRPLKQQTYREQKRPKSSPDIQNEMHEKQFDLIE